MKKEITKIVSDLIRFKTTFDKPTEIDACIKYIVKYFEGTDLVIKKYRSNGVPSLLIANTNEYKDVDLLLNGHIDVVAGQEKQFIPTIKGNKLYGRGAIDMKGSVAVMMYFMKYFATKSDKKVAAMFVSDEEIDGKDGSKYILAKEKLKPKFAIITEESNFDIVTKQKGGYVLSVKVSGKKAHGAEINKGQNAVNIGIALYTNLKQLVESDKDTTLNIFNFKSGLKGIDKPVGQFVPDMCSFELDIRYFNRKIEKMVKKWMTRLNKRKNVSVSIKSYKEIMESTGYKKALRKLRPLIKKYAGKYSKITKTPYASDARFFSVRGLPVVEFGPRGKYYHQDNEYADIESLVTCLCILTKFV